MAIDKTASRRSRGPKDVRELAVGPKIINSHITRSRTISTGAYARSMMPNKNMSVTKPELRRTIKVKITGKNPAVIKAPMPARTSRFTAPKSGYLVNQERKKGGP